MRSPGPKITLARLGMPKWCEDKETHYTVRGYRKLLKHYQGREWWRKTSRVDPWPPYEHIQSHSWTCTNIHIHLCTYMCGRAHTHRERQYVLSKIDKYAIVSSRRKVISGFPFENKIMIKILTFFPTIASFFSLKY